MEGNNYWDNVTSEEMGGNDDSLFSHTAKVMHGLHLQGEILEIGCGMGRLLKPLSEAYPDAQFTGFDPSLSLLNKAPVLPNVVYVHELPNHNKKFDYIYSMLVFQHIPNEQKKEYIRYMAQHIRRSGAIRFQYVTGDYDAPNDHNCTDDDVRGWCKGLRLAFEITQDAKHPNWSWCTANTRRQKK